MSNEKALHLNQYNSVKHCHFLTPCPPPPSPLRIKIILFATFKNAIAAHKDQNTMGLYKYIINSYIKILPVTNNLPLSVTDFFNLMGSAHLTFANGLCHHRHKLQQLPEFVGFVNFPQLPLQLLLHRVPHQLSGHLVDDSLTFCVLSSK